HHDETEFLASVPSPGDQVLEAVVIRPASALTELPASDMKQRIADCGEQLFVERPQVVVDRLLRSPSKKNWQSDFASFKLPFVKQSCSRHRRDNNCCRKYPCRVEDGCCARFIVVLEETQQLLLVSHCGAQMQPDALWVVVLEPIIKSLVVTEVEALLLQLPFETPVGFSD